VHCFCMCSGSALLGDLLGVSRSRERDLLSVLSIYPRIFLCVFIVYRRIVRILCLLICLNHGYGEQEWRSPTFFREDASPTIFCYNITNFALTEEDPLMWQFFFNFPRSHISGVMVLDPCVN